MKTVKIIITLIFLSLMFSCSISKRPKFTYRNSANQKKDEKEFYIKKFRDVVFYKCLKYGYGDKLNLEIGKLMAQKDLFSMSDQPFIVEDALQDSLAINIIKNMPSPYVHVEDKNTIKGKNFIISTCLSYYESNELDSIAKKLYRNQKDNLK